jgi:hypothetical protein
MSFWAETLLVGLNEAEIVQTIGKSEKIRTRAATTYLIARMIRKRFFLL